MVTGRKKSPTAAASVAIASAASPETIRSNESAAFTWPARHWAESHPAQPRRCDQIPTPAENQLLPLDVQRRCERRWAARFSRSTEPVAPRNHQPERECQQLAAPNERNRASIARKLKRTVVAITTRLKVLRAAGA